MDSPKNRGMRDWQVFIRTVEAGSLSVAAKELNMTTGAVSKIISKLEEYTCTSLLIRDTHGIELTIAGRLAYNKALEITGLFADLLEELRNPQKQIRGVLKLSAPVILAEFLANHWAQEFMEIWPGTQIQLDARESSELSQDVPDLDNLILRSGKPENENIVYRELPGLKVVLIATQEYIDNNGCPHHPHDLLQHNVFNLRHNGFGSTLKFTKEDESYEISDLNNMSLSSNNHLSLINLCIEGKGITLGTPGWMKSAYAQQAKLITLMPDWTLDLVPVYLAWRPRKIYSPLFVAFRDYIEKKWIER
ncbi:DNA-binding transcriptional regulator, LysR family [Rosenbergiella nectarea]|uniref:DNA-binding transcriptional regulator, LysR family n=1 Tax=Rosenbergiella nectarea TaxID=988801 RepID=A0A1H9MB57_9GAMM|nr:LysR family transcriptional regulator [Rosenbergiella nectarea]SER20373.1 DNA-binding transcriptional regulator, LysR family [Rosenbergiella nectarea]